MYVERKHEQSPKQRSTLTVDSPNVISNSSSSYSVTQSVEPYQQEYNNESIENHQQFQSDSNYVASSSRSVRTKIVKKIVSTTHGSETTNVSENMMQQGEVRYENISKRAKFEKVRLSYYVMCYKVIFLGKVMRMLR